MTLYKNINTHSFVIYKTLLYIIIRNLLEKINIYSILNIVVF